LSFWSFGGLPEKKKGKEEGKKKKAKTKRASFTSSQIKNNNKRKGTQIIDWVGRDNQTRFCARNPQLALRCAKLSVIHVTAIAICERLVLDSE